MASHLQPGADLERAPPEEEKGRRGRALLLFLVEGREKERKEPLSSAIRGWIETRKKKRKGEALLASHLKERKGGAPSHLPPY